MSSNPQHQKINTHSSTSKATPHPNSIKNGKQQPAASTAASETSAPVIFSTSKKIRKAWNQFEIKLIKAADASKVDARKIKENPNAASAQSRIVDVRTKCLDLMQARDDLRKLLHEAEADVKDNAGELNALNLMAKSSGCCIGSGSGKRGSWSSRALKRRKVE